MKELSIEEKAKRYDEAIDLVNSKWHYKNQPCFIQASEIFPELKESEDDNIRRWIINEIKIKHHNLDEDNVDFVDKAIAWLEKQKDKKDIHLLELKAKAYDDSKERMSYAYNQNRLPIGFISEIFPNLDLYETQDKIEPKFKIGNWVVFNNHHQSIYQVEKIENGYYILRHINGGTFRVCVLHDDGLKLWTLQDAKDGDVLAGKIDGNIYILIYKQIKDGWIETYGHYYYSVNRFCAPSQLFCRDIKADVKKAFRPATEKQRNLLFAKMKEAGYEWNADKKELIKL